MSRNFEDAVAEFAAVSSDPAEAVQLLEIRRLAFSAAERLGQCLVEDVGVPRSKLPDLLERIERVGEEHGVSTLTVPRVQWRLCSAASAGAGVVLTVVLGLELGGWDQPGLAVQPPVVTPVDVLGDRDLEVVDAGPGLLLRTSSALNSELNASARALP